MNEHYLGHRQRLKLKFDDSSAALADYEILELMLGYVIKRKDVKPIAKALLAKSDSLVDIFSCGTDGVDGAGKETDLFFRIVAEFFNRAENSRIKRKREIQSPEDIYQYLKYSLSLSNTEKFAVVFFDSKNHVLGHKIISDGIVNAAMVFPRQIAEAAVKANACSVVISHNHPSGDPSPSKNDIIVTQKIKEALDTLDINLLDHIIVCKTTFASLKAMGHLKE